MRAKKAFLPLLAAMLLISGCQKAEAHTSNETVAAASANNPFSEPNAIDDSYTMPVINYTGDYDADTAARYQTITDYGLSKWFNNPQIVQLNVASGQIMYGWVLFTGEPKQDMGWQTVEVDGQEMYCRSIYATVDGESWNVEKSYATLPYRSIAQYYAELPSTKLPEGCSNFCLANLSSAQLYVRQLDEVFTLEDEAALHKLETALSYQQDNRSGYSYNINMTVAALNPLYLYFEDGSTGLVYTMGDGSCGAGIWGSSMFNSGESLFELFNVPLPSAGYVHNEDGTTTVQVNSYYDKRTASYETCGDTPIESIYDADNKLIANIEPEAA